MFILIYTVLFLRDYCEQNANDEVGANMYLYYLVASKEVDWVLGIIQIIVQCSNFRFYRVQNSRFVVWSFGGQSIIPPLHSS